MERASARERLIDAAYRLFAAQGFNRVGIEAILAESGCAKATLYGNFASKVDLGLAFLHRREELWTRRWLEAGIIARGAEPSQQLLAIFDVFDGWFRAPDFEGCSFINLLLETESGSALRREAATHLCRIRAIIEGLANGAGLAEPEVFAQAWHMLMKGSIVAAGEGNTNAAREAKRAARLVLEGWPRR
jgi:AcrR family transcriptional regulator